MAFKIGLEMVSIYGGTDQWDSRDTEASMV